MNEENIETIRELIDRYELSELEKAHVNVPIHKIKELNNYLRVWYPHATTDSDGRCLYPNNRGTHRSSWVTSMFSGSRNAFYIGMFAEDLGITPAEIREAFNTVSTN